MSHSLLLNEQEFISFAFIVALTDEGETRALMKAIAESLTELETPVGKLPTTDWAVYPSSIFSSHEAKEDECFQCPNLRAQTGQIWAKYES